jgi:hypothetical protein
MPPLPVLAALALNDGADDSQPEAA